MKLEFTKMQGAGNDYIYINAMEQEIDAPEALSVILSDRHFGIGGDGVVLICKSSVADVKMRMFNQDGSEGKMCGNAIRCVAKYVYEHGYISGDALSIETLSGIKAVTLISKDGAVCAARVNMGKAELDPENIPVALPAERVVGMPVQIDGQMYEITCVSMGNPHAVVFCDEVDELNLAKIGPKFECAKIFPERVNTEFVHVIDEHTLKMRVWERGSGETLACGTGACAAAVAAVLGGYCKKGEDIKVHVLGGELVIHYTDECVHMTGDCAVVFEGVIET